MRRGTFILYNFPSRYICPNHKYYCKTLYTENIEDKQITRWLESLRYVSFDDGIYLLKQSALCLGVFEVFD